MKRYISLLLLPVMLFFSVIPASAAETGYSDPWIDILQFGGIVGQDSLTFPVNKSTHTFCEVQNDGVGVGYIELVFSAPNGISGLVVTDRNYPSLDKWWTVKALTSDLYVAYCEYSSRSPETFQFDFYYTGGADYTFITLFSVRALAPYVTPGKLSGQISFILNNGDPQYSSFTNGGQSGTLGATSSAASFATTTIYFTSEQWMGWQYIDFAVQMQNVGSVYAIQAYSNGVIVPFDYSASSMVGTTNASASTGDYLPFWVGRFHLDVSKLTPGYTVALQISWKCNGANQSVSTWGATGTVSVDSLPLLTRWFKRLQVWIDGLGNTITDGFNRLIDTIAPTTSADPLPDSEQQRGEIDSGMNVIGSVTTPSISDSNLDIGSYSGNFLSYGNLLSIPLSNSPTILNVFMMIFILAMGSYILFGKR